MDAAVVELDALADAVGPGGQDHDAGFLVCRTGLLLLDGKRSRVDAHGLLLVGEVVVARLGRELARAGVDGHDGRADAEDLAQGTHDLLARTGEVRDLDVAEAQLLGRKHMVRVKRGKTRPANIGCGLGDVAHTVDVPGINARQVVDLVVGPAAAQSLPHLEDALGCRGGNRRRELVLGHVRKRVGLGVGEEPRVPLLERAQGFLEGLLEGAADGHGLAHRLHAGREGIARPLELLEGEARDLDHAIVERGFEAGRGLLGDVVGDLVERVAHGQKRRRLGDREARRLGRKGRAARDTRVHLDHDDAAVVGIDGELDVGATGRHANALEDGDGVVA